MSSTKTSAKLKGYKPEQPIELASILERASGGRRIDPDLLETELLTILFDAGAAQDDSDEHDDSERHEDGETPNESGVSGEIERRRIWREATAELPTGSQLALGFKKMATAARPLDPYACTRELRPALNGMIYNRWSARWRKEGRSAPASLGEVDWDALTAAEQAEIREMARELARLCKPGAHRPHKADLHTLLGLLADVFVQHTGFKFYSHHLPHAVDSLFVRFVSTALAPSFDPSEVSHSAIAARWRRYKLGRPASKTTRNPRRRLTPRKVRKPI